MNVDRVKVKAVRDGKEGWVTVTGNQGTVYLEFGADPRVHLDRVFKERNQGLRLARERFGSAQRRVAECSAAVEKLVLHEQALQSSDLTGKNCRTRAEAAVAQANEVQTMSEKAHRDFERLAPSVNQRLLEAAPVDEAKKELQLVLARTTALKKLAADAPARAQELADARIAKFDDFRKLVREHAVASDLPLAAVCEKMAEGETLTKSELSAFCAARDFTLAEHELDHLFDCLDVLGEGVVLPAAFASLVPYVYRVATKVPVTSEKEVGKGKIVHQLAPGDVVEALADPVEDGVTKVLRLRVTLPELNAEGWTSVKGNQGTMYLELLTGSDAQDVAMAAAQKAAAQKAAADA